MSKRLSGKNLAILIPASLFFGASVGASISYIWQWPFLWSFAIVNGLGHMPLFIAVSDAIRQELGLRSPAQITGNWAGRPGNKITINAGDKSKDIFMKMLPAPLQKPEIKDTWELKTISVMMDNQFYEVPLIKIEEFVYGVFSRQRQGKHGLARRYWMIERTVCLTPQDYNLMIIILQSVPGLVINRSERKSGYLAGSPKMALKAIQDTF